MTRRESILAVLDGAAVERPPVCVRLGLWHADAVARDVLPAEMRGFSQEQVEDYLGFCRAARHRTRPQLTFKRVETRQRQEGDAAVEEYLFPGKTLVRKTHLPAGGLAPYIVRHPLQIEEDYDIVLSEMHEAYLDFDVTGFDVLDAQTGDAGLPVLILHSCPAHLVMLKWAGYEGFYLHLAES
jgi:hypothetical protein